MKFLLIAASLLAAPLLAHALVSPEVHPDGSVTFRFQDTNAAQVRVHCEGVSESLMTKDDQGVWSLTTAPLDPDIYVYSFNVDGLHVLDPNDSNLKYNLLNTECQVEVPGPDSVPWQINDVPHGELHRHFYESTVTGDKRDYLVYTPPGYDPTSRHRYPVLYLLHGFSDDATAWSSVGRANFILDNLIARGEAKPMLIVMPLGYGTMQVLHTDGLPRDQQQELRKQNVQKFGENLLQEVIPQIEKTYRVYKDRDHRAIAGLSMGGQEALTVGLNHLDHFAWIGGFSSGRIDTNYPSVFPELNADKANRQVRELWISCGRDDKLTESNQQFCDWLQSQGIHHDWIQTPGVHSFRVWRRNLAAFAPLLFQDRKSWN